MACTASNVASINVMNTMAKPVKQASEPSTTATTPDTSASALDLGAAAALRTLLCFSLLMVITPCVLYLGSNNGYFDSEWFK